MKHDAHLQTQLQFIAMDFPAKEHVLHFLVHRLAGRCSFLGASLLKRAQLSVDGLQFAEKLVISLLCSTIDSAWSLHRHRSSRDWESQLGIKSFHARSDLLGEHLVPSGTVVGKGGHHLGAAQRADLAHHLGQRVGDVLHATGTRRIAVAEHHMLQQRLEGSFDLRARGQLLRVITEEGGEQDLQRLALEERIHLLLLLLLGGEHHTAVACGG